MWSIVKGSVMAKITILDKEYPVRQTLRALFIYEELAGKPFSGKNLCDLYIHCYCTLLACNPDTFKMTFSEFIDRCDEDPGIFRSYLDMIKENARIDGQMATKSKKKEEVSPSVSASSIA